MVSGTSGRLREKRFNREFLKRAGHEAIRLHLPSPALLRIALRDVVLSSGVKILEGERVACLFTPANRDVKVFGEDARKFNPYRETQTIKSHGGSHLVEVNIRALVGP